MIVVVVIMIRIIKYGYCDKKITMVIIIIAIMTIIKINKIMILTTLAKE